MDEQGARGSRIGTWIIAIIGLVALAVGADLAARLVVALARAAGGPSEWLVVIVSALLTTGVIFAVWLWWRSQQGTRETDEPAP
jgi:hypothetical protein